MCVDRAGRETVARRAPIRVWCSRVRRRRRHLVLVVVLVVVARFLSFVTSLVRPSTASLSATNQHVARPIPVIAARALVR